jgi:hypothetical protein
MKKTTTLSVSAALWAVSSQATPSRYGIIGLAKFTALALLSTFNLTCATAFAQGTAFTYQGRLNDSGSPANGTYDLRFALFATNQLGSPAAPTLTNTGVSVSNGLFTTTMDFGSGIFVGSNSWLEVSARTNGVGPFSTLVPRQPITPAPYAVFAENVSPTGFSVGGVVAMRYGLNVDTGGDWTNAPNIIGGSPVNYVAAGVVGVTIAGGGGIDDNTDIPEPNTVTANFGTIGGGVGNAVSGVIATIAGGDENTASGFYSTVGGGHLNSATANYATVSGGNQNTASGQEATAAGGHNNTAGGSYATLGGGYHNSASGDYATVGGGNQNIASGDYSFAAGNYAHAQNRGSFVWADQFLPVPFSSTTSNQFRVRSTGGVAFATGIDVNGSVTAGVHLLSGDTAWSSISDKNAKKNFQPVDGKAVLEKLATIPVEQWNYKWEPDTSTPHIGPMAQDFKGAFYPGRDDKSITTLEFDGVELAAIQGLNRKIEEKNAEIGKLEEQNKSLANRLAELERTVQTLAGKK